MSLVSVLTRDLGRNHLPPASQVGVALAGASGGISASEPGAREGRRSDETAPAPRTSAAARRIAAGHVGDPLALDGYVERARRVAALSLGAGGVMALLAVSVDPLGWLPASLLVLSAGLDWAHGRLGARVLIQGGALVIRRGPWGGVRLRRDDIESIDIESRGLGASGRAMRRASATFRRGHFGSPDASHLVVIRLKGNHPHRLVVPEAGVGEARSAVLRLRQWWSSPRGAQCTIGSNASQAVSIALTACSKNAE